MYMGIKNFIFLYIIYFLVFPHSHVVTYDLKTRTTHAHMRAHTQQRNFNHHCFSYSIIV
jgi:hypothetical protein